MEKIPSKRKSHTWAPFGFRGLLYSLYFSRMIMIRTTTQTRVTTRTTRTTTRTRRRATITTMTMTTVRGRISKSSKRLEAVRVLEKKKARTLEKAFRRGSERFCSAERSGGWSSVFLWKQNSQQSALLYVSRPNFFSKYCRIYYILNIFFYCFSRVSVCVWGFLHNLKYWVK